MTKPRIDIEKIICILLGNAGIVYSICLIGLYMLDAASPGEMIINNLSTGNLLIVYCAATAAAGIYLHTRILREDATVSFRGILPKATAHLSTAMALVTETLAITNLFNRSMGFVMSEPAKVIGIITASVGALAFLCIVGFETEK